MLVAGFSHEDHALTGYQKDITPMEAPDVHTTGYINIRHRRLLPGEGPNAKPHRMLQKAVLTAGAWMKQDRKLCCIHDYGPGFLNSWKKCGL